MSTCFRVVFYTLLSVLKWVKFYPLSLMGCIQDSLQDLKN